MANVIGLSQEHEDNLRKLADYLLSGNLMADFDMRRYSSRLGLEWNQQDCGTVGCAAGHGPYAGMPKALEETWAQYTKRQFGLSYWEGDVRYDWCFDDDWAEVDNSPIGAAKRIIYLLDEGMPDNWSLQLHGSAHLCYM